jgi:uncharacterized protein YqgC (DUF456 family)
MKRSENLIKKALGIIFVILGLIALITPFTPGAWLIFVGLEFLGIRFLFWDKKNFGTRRISVIINKQE